MDNSFWIGRDTTLDDEDTVAVEIPEAPHIEFDANAALEAAGVPAPVEITPEELTPEEPFAFEEDQVMEDTGNPKDLIGASKPDLSLVPPAGLLYEAQAMMDGAAKYGPYNWRAKPVKMRVYIAAAMRHLQQLLDGEDFDPISNVHHIGHARACLGIVADALEVGNIIDDRPLPGPAGTMIRKFGEKGNFQ